MRAHALAPSPFYAKFHRGLENASLQDLPVLNKSILMENFDTLVTDRTVTLAAVENHLANPSAPRLFRNRYTLAATSGTTGTRGIFLHDTEE